MGAPNANQDGGFHLDHNAGTPVDERVLAHFVEVERECAGNPASVHRLGRRARAVLEHARSRVAAALAVEVDEVVFCSGGTEANNLAVLGLGDPSLPVLLAPLEHPSVLEPARKRGTVSWSVDDQARAEVCDPGSPVGLVGLVHAQSEVGSLQPVVAAAALAAKMQVPLHVDAAQTLGRVPLDEVVRCATSIALSPHKCGGLRGSGVLVVRDAQRRLRPLLRGGGQEHGLRPGTVSPALASATALSIELAIAECAQRAAVMASARERFVDAVRRSGIAHRLLTPLTCSVPNTAMLAFEGVDGRNLLPALDLVGVAASHGSACSSGSPQPPSVLLAMGLPESLARACVRFSFDYRVDAEFGARAGRCVAEVLARLQKKS